MMVRKILLIDVDNDRSQYTASQLHSRWSHHPIGLMYIASAVQKVFPDITVKIIHTFTSPNPLQDIEATVIEFSPDLIGLRALSIAQNHFKQIAAMIKRLAPAIPLLGGGPHTSSSFDDIISAGIVDCAVIGEGEQTFIEIVDWMNKYGNLPTHIKGTAVADNGGVHLNEPRPPIEDLDAMPFPAYELIKLSDYAGVSNLAFQDTSQCAFICGSRGCSFHCVYCHQFFGKRVRRRSAESIIAEMKQHKEKRGIKNYVFVDDLFNVPIEKGKELLSHIIKNMPDVRINFPNGMRADQIDDELIDLLEEVGTVHMALAVESGSPRVQKLIGKNLNLDKAWKWIDKASRKFIVCGLFMIGFPSETLEEAMETIRFAEALEYLAEPTCNVVRVYNKTKLSEMLEPNAEQNRALIEQEQKMLQPKLSEDPGFYGDLFPREKVPLRSDDIQTLQWEWVRRILNNPNRIINSHKILESKLNKHEVIEFYKNLYDNPGFNEKTLQRLLKSAAKTITTEEATE
jgi:anaerobic magnesium-protoporphyrin IX monomethyl ester cyclase